MQTYFSDISSLLPQFQISIKFYKKRNNVVEKLYKEHLFEEEKNIYFGEYPIGTFLTEIMNNNEKINKLLSAYEDKIINEKLKWRINNKILDRKIKNRYSDEYKKSRKNLDIKFNDNCIKILLSLKKDLSKINKKLSVLDIRIDKFLFDFDNNYPAVIKRTRRKLAKMKAKNPNISTKPHYNMTHEEYKETGKFNFLINELKRDENITYIYTEFKRFIQRLKFNFDDGIEFMKSSFIHSEENRNNKFSGIQSILPLTYIEYETDNKFPVPKIYTYNLNNIKELFYVCIYQLSLNHKVIIKCKECKKYIIPDRSDRQYCSDQCRWKHLTKNTKDDSPTYKYYRKLYNWCKNNKTYSKEFEQIKEIYKNCKMNNLKDEEIAKILLDFEDKVKSTYNVKRGRPKKD